MAGRRLVGLDWVIELGRAPRTDRKGSRQLVEGAASAEEIAREIARKDAIQQAVRNALSALTEDEREFVERFYYMGLGYYEISEKSGRAIHKLEALHRRALRKLRKELASFVTERFQSEPVELSSSDCDLCNSPYRPQIDLLIEHKEESQTWREVIREIREKYGIRIRTPQTLIGHRKYH